MDSTEKREIKLVRDSISYTSMVEVVDLAVKYSFSTGGVYHKYLQDFGETLAIMLAYTDYQIQQNEQTNLFEEVMTVCHSQEWKTNVLQAIGHQYEIITEYIDDEIEQKIRPLAKVDATIDSIKTAVDGINTIIGALDVEKLKGYDYSKIIDAVSALGEKLEETEETKNNKNNENADNIVSINKKKESKD